jgi:hypothetical protein
MTAPSYPGTEDALRLLAAEDARQSKLHDLLETIREQIRLEVPPEYRPEGLFQNIQDAVYAMRGRMSLMNDVAITAPLSCPAWRCFHCDEVFTELKAAANHFGVDHLGDETLCQMAQVDGGIARVIADLAEELQRYRMEDNTSYREFYSLGADHRAALVKEEQKGYDRGIADARIEGSSGVAQASGWQPIETAPQDETWVLVWERYINLKYHPAEVARYRDGKWRNSANKIVDVVTHWMPIPEAPSVSSTSRVGLLDPGIDGPYNEPCEHKSVHDGPRIEVVYGTAPTQVCDCGMWRTMLHLPGPWQASTMPPADSGAPDA